MAQEHGKAEMIDFSKVDTYTKLQELTKGRGPDRCIDAVGREAHAASTLGVVADQIRTAVMPSDQMHAVNEAIKCCRKGGTISVPGAYAGLADKLLFGAFMNKGLTKTPAVTVSAGTDSTRTVPPTSLLTAGIPAVLSVKEGSIGTESPTESTWRTWKRLGQF
ncbi:Zinc-binding dehydrogenase [Anatilimnocola aggregata]|uniref:Zinc-binding dehydrogenase n=1 Tax=Anatilimnocola aggregata TaxID=2528021 RepID=A0A517YN91_9BACT|nr:hypothetical protein [Anatilimnocola aggregata]QDU31685.1 Zinc-binding dehydrogenase [Anatilimnocola aggregata]